MPAKQSLEDLIKENSIHRNQKEKSNNFFWKKSEKNEKELYKKSDNAELKRNIKLLESQYSMIINEETEQLAKLLFKGA